MNVKKMKEILRGIEVVALVMMRAKAEKEAMNEVEEEAGVSINYAFHNSFSQGMPLCTLHGLSRSIMH